MSVPERVVRTTGVRVAHDGSPLRQSSDRSSLGAGREDLSYLAVAGVNAEVLVHLVGLIDHVLEERLVVVDVGRPVAGTALNIEPKAGWSEHSRRAGLGRGSYQRPSYVLFER